MENINNNNRQIIGFVGDSSSDRLSNLPDAILEHILSFSDTVYAVRTSVLSRRWRSVWKHLPALRFKPHGSFQQHINLVDKVLSLSDRAKVDEIVYSGQDCDIDLYHRVIDYAVSHHAQRLQFDLDKCCCFEFYELFGSISCPDLKILQLGDIFSFHPGSARFPTLTTLELKGCGLGFSQLDCSLNFPCLTNLGILDCSSDPRTKVYAPQLVTLKMDRGHGEFGIEVIAPRLEFFRLEVWARSDGRGVPEFTLPYVDRAEISVREYVNSDGRSLNSDLKALFRRLHSARSLLLRCATSETLEKIRKFLEQKPVCLAKLESLICVSDDAPYEVVTNQVEGRISRSRS